MIVAQSVGKHGISNYKTDVVLTVMQHWAAIAKSCLTATSALIVKKGKYRWHNPNAISADLKLIQRTLFGASQILQSGRYDPYPSCSASFFTFSSSLTFCH